MTMRNTTSIHLSLMLMFSALVSCVDTYDVIPAGYVDPMLVVDGNIYSGQPCTFTLMHTVSLDASVSESLKGVEKATLTVCGSTGERFEAIDLHDGRYQVEVGTLSSDATYWLEISAPGYGFFTSEPMSPLYAPEIVEFTFQSPSGDGPVDFYVTTSDMTKGERERSFLLWRYEECYIVNAPLKAIWYYDPVEDVILPIPQLLNHGWRETSPTDRFIASNEDFDCGAIRNYCVYQRSNQDYRFMERYRTCLYQESISEQEYEYRHLLATQSSEMGGLFTPMPTELPSNVHGKHGEKAVGFVGVRGSVTQKELYVNRREVGYHFIPRIETVTNEKHTNRYMYNHGLRVAIYLPDMGEQSLEWAARWVVDVTDPYWGASLEKPDYWEDGSEEK